MKAVIIDTTGEFVRIGFVDGTKSDAIVAREGRASLTLLSALDALLERNNTAVNELDAIGAVVGPGSFTGIRIGISSVKAIAYALNIPVFAVNSLRTLAYNDFDSRVFVVTDAGNGFVYAGMYQSGEELLAPVCLKRDELAGLEAQNGATQKIFFEDCSGLIRAARECIKCGNLIDGDRLEALYVRKHAVDL